MGGWVDGDFEIFNILLIPPQPFTGLFLMIPGPFEYFSEKWVPPENQSFLNETAII